jgi:hypothetical protein
VLSGGVGDLDSVRRSSIVASHPLDKGKLGVQSTAWYAVVAYDGNDHWQVFCAVRRLSSCASIERSPRNAPSDHGAAPQHRETGTPKC